MSVDSLVISANGLVGQEVFKALSARGQNVIGTSFSRGKQGLESLDILDHDAVKNLIENHQPKYIYLCSNRPGGVNRCEVEAEEARAFHFEATKNIANIAKGMGAKLVYYSTDYVFSDHSDPVTEETTVNPLNVYGKVKVESEQFLKDELPNALIIRTTNIYGWDPTTKTPNYFMNVYRKLSSGEQVEAPAFLNGTPTYANDLAEVTVQLAEKDEQGIFHVVGDEYINRYEWVLEIAKELNFNAELVKPLETMPASSVKRPEELKLSNQKMIKTINYKMKGLSEALQEIKGKL